MSQQMPRIDDGPHGPQPIASAKREKADSATAPNASAMMTDAIVRILLRVMFAIYA
jgi:hypothetical protein